MPRNNNTLTKLQLAEVRETFGSPKILRNVDELSTHNKTYEALSALCKKIQVAVHNNNMELANKLVEETFVKLKKMKLKRPISANEFKSYLNNKSKILKFTKNINSIAENLAKVAKYEGLITKTLTAVKGLNDLYKTKKKKKFVIEANKLAEDREKLKDAYAKMKVIMSCADIIGEFAPAGISEYIEFNASFFRNAEIAVNIAATRAELITNANKGIDTLNEALNGKIKNKYGSYTAASASKMSQKQIDDF